MTDVYVHLEDIPEESQETFTGVVYYVNGQPKKIVKFAGIIVATEEQSNNEDLGWVDL